MNQLWPRTTLQTHLVILYIFLSHSRPCPKDVDLANFIRYHQWWTITADTAPLHFSCQWQHPSFGQHRKCPNPGPICGFNFTQLVKAIPQERTIKYLRRKVAINQVIFSSIIHFDWMPLPNLPTSSNKMVTSVPVFKWANVFSFVVQKDQRNSSRDFSKATHIPDDNTAIIACTHGYPWIEWMDIQYISLQAHNNIHMANKIRPQVGQLWKPLLPKQILGILGCGSLGPSYDAVKQSWSNPNRLLRVDKQA